MHKIKNGCMVLTYLAYIDSYLYVPPNKFYLKQLNVFKQKLLQSELSEFFENSFAGLN